MDEQQEDARLAAYADAWCSARTTAFELQLCCYILRVRPVCCLACRSSTAPHRDVDFTRRERKRWWWCCTRPGQHCGAQSWLSCPNANASEYGSHGRVARRIVPQRHQWIAARQPQRAFDRCDWRSRCHGGHSVQSCRTSEYNRDSEGGWRCLRAGGPSRRLRIQNRLSSAHTWDSAGEDTPAWHCRACAADIATAASTQLHSLF